MATGQRLQLFLPSHYEPPTLDYATRGVRNYHLILKFTAGWFATFKAVLPGNYSGGGITAKIHYAMASAITGNVKWSGAFERIGTTQDTDSDSFAGQQTTGDIAVPGTSGMLGVGTITFGNGADIDSLLVGELFRFQLQRAAAISNEAAGQAQVFAVELLET